MHARISSFPVQQYFTNQFYRRSATKPMDMSCTDVMEFNTPVSKQ